MLMMETNPSNVHLGAVLFQTQQGQEKLSAISLKRCYGQNVTIVLLEGNCWLE